LGDDLRSGAVTRQDLARQRSDLTKSSTSRCPVPRHSSKNLDSLPEQSAQDAARANALDAKVNDLNRLLHDREVALDQKDELLAHDRDIRELMDARDL
jgi:hypothetical protein